MPQRAHRVRRLMFPRVRNASAARWHWLVNVVAASPAVSAPNRAHLLRLAGLDVRTGGVQAGSYFFGSDISIGEGTWVNHGCHFDTRDHIEIGEGCSLAMDVMVCTSTHEIGDSHKRAGAYRTAPVTIGDGTWIGTRSVILPGVRIGAGCVVGAGAVVADDLPPDGVYAGSPARRMRDL